MPISTQDAAQALNAMAATQRRAAILRGYERGAPHFLWWGPLWMLGYGLSAMAPDRAGLIWLVLDVIGIAGSVLLGRAAAASSRRLVPGDGVRFLALSATLVGFIFVTYAVMAPREPAQFAVFPALLMAAIYTGVGLWSGLRWVVAGVVLATCTLAGFVLLKPYFMLWMAIVGGGTLVLTGLWLRRA